MDDDKPLETPIDIGTGSQARQRVSSVREMLALLQGVDWPGERGQWHRDAVETCLKVLDGHRSLVDATDAFANAAAEAGLRIED